MLEQGIIIKFKGEIRKILPQEIIFIEQNLRKVKFHLASEICTTYGKLDSYEEQLTEGFYKCNKSYIINLDKVVRMGEQIIYFSDGHSIWLGKQSFCGAKKAFLRFAVGVSESKKSL